MKLELKRRKCWIGPGEDASYCNDSKDEDGILKLKYFNQSRKISIFGDSLTLLKDECKRSRLVGAMIF